jgi:hypothetical protein
LRNKIGKHVKLLKGKTFFFFSFTYLLIDFLLAKYDNSISGSSEPSLAPPSNSQQRLSATSPSSSVAATAANHPLSTILDPALVMAMLVNPSLYSHVQQQVLSNPNFVQAYQHMFAEGATTNSLPPKVASETQVVPSTTTTTPKAAKEQQQQQQNVLSTRSRPVLTQATKPIQLTLLESDFDNEQRNKTKTRFNSSETTLTESQQQEIALTQELIRRQLALTQQQPRNQRNLHATSQLSLSTPFSRHIPLTTEQMQEVLTRAKNYVTRQQSDETTDSSNTQPRLSYNTRRLQAALAASASSSTPQTAHTIGQAAAAAIAAVSARPSLSSTTGTTTTTTITTKPTPSSSNSIVTPTALIPPLSQQQQQQHPIRIQLDQKSKTLSSISNNQSLPIPTISQQKIMPLVDVNTSAPPHMYQNQPNWQRPPHLPGPHYPMPPHQPQYPPYDNPHTPPYYGPRPNYPPDMRPPPPSYGPLPPRHLSQPPRYNGPLPPPGPYGYGHPPQNYGPLPPPHPHYGHHYPPS